MGNQINQIVTNPRPPSPPAFLSPPFLPPPVAHDIPPPCVEGFPPRLESDVSGDLRHARTHKWQNHGFSCLLHANIHTYNTALDIDSGRRRIAVEQLHLE
uniref:Uncharacterized protein n=1 Tax=Photinus pyralis TaxID=7054 RepID=A0A1Y1KQY5_PHOPY